MVKKIWGTNSYCYSSLSDLSNRDMIWFVVHHFEDLVGKKGLYG